LPVYEHWVDFCSLSVQSFIDQNRSEKVNSISTTRNSNAIEIDELPDDPVDTQVYSRGGSNLKSRFSGPIRRFSRAEVGPTFLRHWNCHYILAKDIQCAIPFVGHQQQQNFHCRNLTKTHGRAATGNAHAGGAKIQ